MSHPVPCGYQSDPPAEGHLDVWMRELVGSIIIVLLAVVLLIPIVLWETRDELDWLHTEELEQAIGILAVFVVLTALFAVVRLIKAYAKLACEPFVGAHACWAGVIEATQRNFAGARSVFFPWAANHPFVDVVVKEEYWPLAIGGAHWVHCSHDGEPPGYIIRIYFFSDQVCKVAQATSGGALTVAAIVAFLVGTAAGVAAAGAVATAVGCATIFLCPLAVAAFILVAVLVAVLLLLALAMLIGNIVRAALSDDDPLERESPPESGAEAGVPTDEGRDEWLRTGDLVTASGNLVAHPDLAGAKVGWWVDPTDVFIHGRSDGQRPFTHVDADVIEPDAC